LRVMQERAVQGDAHLQEQAHKHTALVARLRVLEEERECNVKQVRFVQFYPVFCTPTK
jgi:hypothetical protein